MFSDSKEYKVPDVILDMSGKRVLTMEFVEAVSLGDEEGLIKAGIDIREVARLLAEGFAK